MVLSTPAPGTHFVAASISSATDLPNRQAASVAYLERCSVAVLLHCLSFLDTNSLLFGALPAVHSLRELATVVSSAAYGRRVMLERFGAVSDAALWSDELLAEWHCVSFQKHRAAARKWYDNTYSGGTRVRAWARAIEQIDREERSVQKRSISWTAVVDLQTRVNEYLIRVMQQRKEHVLPQLYSPPPPPLLPLASSPPAPPGTMRPIFLAVPDAVLQLLLCVPPFHPLPTSAGHNELSTTSVCLPHVHNNASPHHADFVNVLFHPDEDEDDDVGTNTLYALYMGPVYVYENEHTASKRVAVHMTQLRTLKDQDGQPILPRVEGEQPAVRLLFVDDVNQLPVISRDCDTGDIEAVPQTLRACFGSRGVFKLITKT